MPAKSVMKDKTSRRNMSGYGSHFIASRGTDSKNPPSQYGRSLDMSCKYSSRAVAFVITFIFNCCTACRKRIVSGGFQERLRN